MIRTFAPYLRPVRGALAASLAASIVQAAMQWLEPWPLKLIFDSVIGTHPLPGFLAFLPVSPGGRLTVLALAMLVIAAWLGIFRYVADRLVAQAGQRVVFAIRSDLFRHIESQSLSFHERRLTGDLLSRLGGDVQSVQGVMVNAIPVLVNNVLALAGMLAIMFWIDWRYTLVAVSLTPVLYLAVRGFLGRIKSQQRRARRWEGMATGVAQEVLTSITAVQAFGREDDEADRYGRASAHSLEASQEAVAMQAAFTPTVTFLMTTATVLVVWFGAESVLSGRLTPGDLLVFMAYLRGMYSPVRQLAKLGNVVTRGMAAAERLAETLSTDERIPERPSARRPAKPLGALSFRGVSLEYANGTVALDDVSLDISASARVAIVGATGSGKSSMLQLVPRFYDPCEGSVELDGVDLRDLTIAGLRELVAYVPQEPYLFQGPVWENITYGGHGLSREAAVVAARAAGVHEVLARLPDGYDTVVSERGASLSGGQRQCIALARAMVRDPRVILLVEPTTGLDEQAQQWLLDALERVSRGRTTLVVSHERRVVEWADVVVAIASGRVVATGTAADAFERVFGRGVAGEARDAGPERLAAGAGARPASLPAAAAAFGPPPARADAMGA